MDIPLILSNFYKGQLWVLTGRTYDGLEWDETNTLPKPTLEELTEKWNEHVAAQPLKELRTKRNTLLEQTDKYALPDWPHSTPEVRQAWLDYRQALRELPSTTEDPENPVWPVRPDEVTEENTSNVVSE